MNRVVEGKRLSPEVFARHPKAHFLGSALTPNSEIRLMDINFKCPQCSQDLTVDSSGAGMQIECPACNKSIVVPQARPEPHIVNPIMASAAAREEKHFVVPQHAAKVKEVPIEKAKPTLEASAKETDKKIQVKTIRRSDCVEVGKDHFDEIVTKFLQKVGEENVKEITPITYTHQDLATRQWVTDFGVMVVFRG